MNKKAFLPYIEWFRGLSILLIVLSHIRSSILPKEYYYVLQNATVYFLFISGFLFHYLYNPQETVVSFYIKKIQRLILPYLVAALPGFLILMADTGSVPNLVYQRCRKVRSKKSRRRGVTGPEPPPRKSRGRRSSSASG